MKVKAVIDRIEEGYHAVLMVGEEEAEVHWPAKYLPAGAKESDILEFTLAIDKDATQEQKKKIVNLIDKLKNKPR